MTLAYKAMEFARWVHARQFRKYTGNPYADHLAEVAGIAMSVGWHVAEIHPDKFMATCWLHDCVEDQAVKLETLLEEFGEEVAGAVMLLTAETKRKLPRSTVQALARDTLAKAPGWVQTIKVADIISNTASVAMHDRHFASVYLPEKQQMLDVLTKADARLLEVARAQCGNLLPIKPWSRAERQA